MFYGINIASAICKLIFHEQQNAVDIVFERLNPVAVKIMGFDFTGKTLNEIGFIKEKLCRKFVHEQFDGWYCQSVVKLVRWSSVYYKSPDGGLLTGPLETPGSYVVAGYNIHILTLSL